MDWVRGDRIGHGSFGTVSLAIPRGQERSCFHTPFMAVKSCGVTHSASLMNEKRVLDELKGCKEIVSCYGDDHSFENGEKLYNVLLEYASGGSLAKRVASSGDRGLPESEVRGYTKAILRGLEFIHRNGYVHCDIKLQNILLTSDGGVKIADFGLARKKGGDFGGCELRGTPLYMSPEMVAGGVQEAPADIWALGCVVAEMVKGSPAWRCSDMAALLMRIGVGGEVPEIPGEFSPEGKDLLQKCFVKDPAERWTAEMLLSHPFVDGEDEDEDDDDDDDDYDVRPSTSPRCPFDYPDWVSEHSCTIPFSPSSGFDFVFDSWSTSPAERLKGLVCDHKPLHDWSVEDGWVTAR